MAKKPTKSKGKVKSRLTATKKQAAGTPAIHTHMLGIFILAVVVLLVFVFGTVFGLF